MAQSEIQTLIQQLAGVQTQAQQGASNSANNGNPNTVYNQSAWGYGGPPAMNQQGDWSMNNLSRPPTITLGGWQPPAGWGGVGNGTGPVLPINGGMPTNPSWTPAPIPGDPNTPGVTTPTTGGTVPPTTTTTPPVRGSSIYPGQTDTPWSPLGNRYYNPPNTYSSNTPGTQGNYSNSDGTGFNLGAIGNAVSGVVNSLRENAGLGSGGISFGQLLDTITEPFIPGDFYNGQLGNVNKPNVVAGVLNMVIPGVGNLADFIAGKIPDSATGLLGKIRDFFAKGDIQAAVDEIYKQAAIDEANGKQPYKNPYSGVNELADGTPLVNWSRLNSWRQPAVGGTPTVTVGGIENINPLPVTGNDLVAEGIRGAVSGTADAIQAGLAGNTGAANSGYNIGGSGWASATGNAFGGLLGHFQGDSGDPWARFRQAT